MSKTVIITGANRGIGKGIAYVFASKGYNIFLAHCGEAEKAYEKAKEIKEKYGKECVTFDGNLAEEDVIKELVKKAVEAYGHIDVLVNNAGVGYEKYIQTSYTEEIDYVYKVNFRAGIILAKLVAQHMIDEKIKGTILFTSSEKATTSNAIDCIYGAMKAGLQRAVRSMAIEYGPYGIRINAIAPGCIAVYTKGYEHLKYDELKNNIPIGRTGTGEDIGYTAAFLASDEAGFITGIEILVDGGERCGAPADQELNEQGIKGLGTFIMQK